jgi:hypothetical protein
MPYPKGLPYLGRPPRRHGEHGVAMVSTLVTVIILGVIAGVVLSESSHSKSGPSTHVSGSLATTTTTPQSIGTEAQLAAVSGCETNFTAIATAVQTYSAENGSPPPAGTAWATSSTDGGPFLQSWPTDPAYYSITWSGASESVIPKKGVASHGTMGTSSPATGCYAA